MENELCGKYGQVYSPLRASSYLPLPNKIAVKKGVLNIQNEKDEKCFLWCILAHRAKIDRENQTNAFPTMNLWKPLKWEMCHSPFPLTK